jgi:hypothetical protein
MDLRQSTAVTLKIGPYLDETDGKTAETGLTLSQADIRLSKNGGNMAQKNEASACTHDEIGVYGCPVDTTDTNTLGRLQLFSHESGALPVWHEYMVLPANVWDALYGSDMLKVDVHAVDDDEAAADNLESALDNYSVTRGLAGTALPAAAADAAGGLPVSDAGGLDLDTQIGTDIDAILADTNELQADWTNGGRLDLLIDAIKAVTDNLPDSGALSDLATILTDTGELQTDWTNGGRLDLLIDAIIVHLTDLKGTGFVKDTDSLVDLAHIGADGDTLETLSDQIDGVATLGAGAITFTYTLTSDADGSPITDASVWVTSDEPGNNVLASGTTDSNGQVTFYLDAGTVYFWRQKGGFNFTATNPDTEIVA